MSSRLHIRLALALLALSLAVAACGEPALAPASDLGSKNPTSSTMQKDADDDATTDVDKKKKVEDEKAKDKEEGTTKIELKVDFECPVTIPSQPGFTATKPPKVTYSKDFPAPDPWPSEFPDDGMVWYGSEDLWTALAVDGNHSPRKSVWWSVNFPGGIEEEQPAASVTWTRLDTKEPAVIDNGGEATNAYIPEQGWFMIAGIDPPDAGCWEVEATYKGATLSYVYEKKG